MALQCGIVGLPNVGKSTLFNALTRSEVSSENYPFCTIDPNIGVVSVPDPRLCQLADIVSPEKIIPAGVEFVDIAGLVEGASEGEGLGNKFLSHIRQTDAIVHIVRAFEDPNVIHVRGAVSPADDIAIIQAELALADLDTIKNALIKNSRHVRSGEKDAKVIQEILLRAEEILNRGERLQTASWTLEEKAHLTPLFLLTMKPLLYVANLDEAGLKGNPLLDAIQAIAAKENTSVIPICAAIEAELSLLGEEDKIPFLQAYGLAEPGLHRLIRGGYQLLGLQTFFTAGPQEVRAWTVRCGACAPEAAGKIHTDFEKGFIRAEVVSFADFISCRGEVPAKAAGKWRLEGKEYVIQDGDVVHFRFGA